MEMTGEGSRIAQHETGRKTCSTISATAKGTGHGARQGEFLTFRLGAEEYGVDILRVQEIRSYEPPARIANSPAFLKGVVNPRGVIVQIVDLRSKLRCVDAEYNHFTVVIVPNLRARVIGVVVDSVSDVLQLAGDTIRPAPVTNAIIDATFITGIASVAGRILILMDIEPLMGSTRWV